MAVAGLVVGSLALLLSLFGAVVSAIQVFRYIRFRKPRFAVQKAVLDVTSSGNIVTSDGGTLDLVIRGSNRPARFTSLVFWFHSADDRRVLAGQREDIAIDVAAEDSRQVSVRIPQGSPVTQRTGVPPSEYVLVVELKTPEEGFSFPVRLRLDDSGARYYFYPVTDWNAIRNVRRLAGTKDVKRLFGRGRGEER